MQALWGLPSLAGLGTLTPPPLYLIWADLLGDNRSRGAEISQYNSGPPRPICLPITGCMSFYPRLPNSSRRARRATESTDHRLMRNNKMFIVSRHKIFCVLVHSHILLSFLFLFSLYPFQRAWVKLLVYWSHSCHKHAFHFLKSSGSLVLLSFLSQL